MTQSKQIANALYFVGGTILIHAGATIVGGAASYPGWRGSAVNELVDRSDLPTAVGLIIIAFCTVKVVGQALLALGNRLARRRID